MISSKWVAAFSLLTMASACRADVAFVELMPAQPHAGETISMVMFYVDCDSLNGNLEVSQSGHEIRAIVDGARGIDPFCWAPPSQYAFPLGSFEAGAWVLQIDYRHNDTVAGGTVINTIDTITFDVLLSAAGASPASVPTLGWWGRFGLTLLVLAVAIGTVRRRFMRNRV